MSGTAASATSDKPFVPPPGGELMGHPKGLYVLFSTELWERFSFYSMRGILTLYMVKALLFAGSHTDHVYGAYLGFVYAATFVGGMLADRLLGQRRAIYIGGLLMSLAQFTLTTHALIIASGRHEYPVHAPFVGWITWITMDRALIDQLHWVFFIGLALLACGNGFFKPNISTIVGTLYEPKDARRDSAFTIFYMGINVGATLASFSGGIAEKWGWYLGYLLAGIGMIASLVIIFGGRGWIADRGLPPIGASLLKGPFGIPNGLLLLVGIAVFLPVAAYLISKPQYVQNLALYISIPVLAYLLWEAARTSHAKAGTGMAGTTMIGLLVVLLGIALFTSYQIFMPKPIEITESMKAAMGPYSWLTVLFIRGWEAVRPLPLSAYAWLPVLVAMLICIWMLASRGTRTEEGGRMVVIVVLCCFSMLFWGFFELAGSTITRFTEQKIDRIIFGWELPAAFVVNFVNPFLIIFLSIPFSWLWIWLDRRGWEPTSPFKFVMGLVQLALGFIMLWIGATQAGSDGKCGLIWLVLCFFLITTGELCLSPVGLSMITKLAPARLVGMFMGVWFLSSALANVFASQIGGMTEKRGFDGVFLLIAAITAVASVVLLCLAPMLKKNMHGIK